MVEWGTRFRVREWLARSWLVVPAAYVVIALVLGATVPEIDTADGDLLGLRLSEEAATQILSAIAGGMIAFTGFVVAVAVVVVQFGASQYTPRLVLRFRRDPVVKHALGIFVAPALFAVISLRNIGREGEAFVPNLTVGVGLLLLLLAVFAFFVLMGRLLDLLRPRRLFAQLARAADRAVLDVYPEVHDDDRPGPDVLPPVTGSVDHPGPDGVISGLDRRRLVRAARDGDAVVELLRPIGAYVGAGEALFQIRGGAQVPGDGMLARCVVVAEERTITHDPAFAIRAIVDIALRSLSPAVNDPTTGVQALDVLGPLLRRAAGRDLQSGRARDASGSVRLVYPVPGWRLLLDLALTEIRHYGADSPQIARRMRALLVELLECTPPARHEDVREHVALLDATIARVYPDASERAFASVPDRLGLGAPRRSDAGSRAW